MLMFCPTCANILQVEEGPNCLRFSCSTCPYIHNIGKRIGSRTYPKLKQVTYLGKLTFRFKTLHHSAMNIPPILTFLHLGRRRSRGFRCVGKRGPYGGHVPTLFAREGVLHADPDPVGRRAHDDVLQVLQARVRAQMEGLSGDEEEMAAKRVIQTLVMPVVAKNNNGSV